MSELDSTIAELEARLDRLVRTQIDFQKEISTIRGELIRLRDTESRKTTATYRPVNPIPAKPATEDAIPPRQSEPSRPAEDIREVPTWEERAPSFGMKDPSARRRPPMDRTAPPPASSFADPAMINLEKFIGENLIS